VVINVYSFLVLAAKLSEKALYSPIKFFQRRVISIHERIFNNEERILMKATFFFNNSA
jgi:hypothetical protein